MDWSSDSLRIKFCVLHQQIALLGNTFFRTLFRLDLLTKDRNSYLVANQVGAARNLNQLGVFEAFTQLAYETPFNGFLILRLVVEDLDLGAGRGRLVVGKALWLLILILLVSVRGRHRLILTQFLKLLHHVDAARQSFSGLGCHVHLVDVAVHLAEVVIHQLIHNLRRQIYPNVQNTSFIPPLKCFFQILFNCRDNLVGATEISGVPLAI